MSCISLYWSLSRLKFPTRSVCPNLYAAVEKLLATVGFTELS